MKLQIFHLKDQLLLTSHHTHVSSGLSILQLTFMRGKNLTAPEQISNLSFADAYVFD